MLDNANPFDSLEELHLAVFRNNPSSRDLYLEGIKFWKRNDCAAALASESVENYLRNDGSISTSRLERVRVWVSASLLADPGKRQTAVEDFIWNNHSIESTTA